MITAGEAIFELVEAVHRWAVDHVLTFAHRRHVFVDRALHVGVN